MMTDLNQEDLERYCGWRRQWRANLDTQAIAVHCRHGMARALELTASLPAPEPTNDIMPEFDSIPIIQEAAAMVNDLLIHEYQVNGI